MKNILMVCLGNVCRSPMAEGYLKHLSKKLNLDLQVSSVGIKAMLGWDADPFAIKVMSHHGIDISQHRPRQLTSELLVESDLVLVMETWQRKELGCLFPSAYGKVHNLGKWEEFEVPDPYRKPLEHFEATYLLIEQGLQRWKEKIWR